MSNSAPIHICLVSEQAAANLLPCCDASFRPRKVILLTSPEMMAASHSLGEALKQRGIEVMRHMVRDAFDPKALDEDLRPLMARLDPRQVMLNSTGGTKPLSHAMEKLCEQAEVPIFYQVLGKNKLVWLNKEWEERPIRADLKVDEYVAAYGYTVKHLDRSMPPDAHLRAAFQVAKEAAHFHQALPVLNGLAFKSEKNNHLQTEVVDNYWYTRADLQELVDLFARAKLLSWHDQRLVFADERARDFVRGGWLEALVYGAVRYLADSGKLHISDCVRNLEVQTPKGGDNEIDVALFANNRLWLIECKTMRFKSKRHDVPDGEKASNVMYKMSCLRDLGGLGTRSMLVSFQPLGPMEELRAEDLRLRVLFGEALADLGKELLAWMGGGQ